MNCREAKSLFSARVDGELSGIESAALESHFAVCPSCSDDARSIASTVLLLRTMPQESPDPMFIGRVLDRVRGYEHDQLAAARSIRQRELATPWWRRIVERLALKPIPVGVALAVGAFAGFLIIQAPIERSGSPTSSLSASNLAKQDQAPAKRVSPFEDVVSRQKLQVDPTVLPVRNDSGRVVPTLNPAQGAPVDASAPVEVLAPDWWNGNASESKVQTVGTQSGGASVVVF